MRSPRKGWKPKILSYSQFKFWLRFEGDCDPGRYYINIIQYVNGTIELRLFYPKHISFNLLGYYDANFVGFKVNCKSTSGTCHFLGNFLFSWSPKKQNCVALSMTEKQYIAAGFYCAQIR